MIDKSVDKQPQDSSEINTDASLETKSKEIPEVKEKDTNLPKAEDKNSEVDKRDIGKFG